MCKESKWIKIVIIIKFDHSDFLIRMSRFTNLKYINLYYKNSLVYQLALLFYQFAFYVR